MALNLPGTALQAALKASTGRVNQGQRGAGISTLQGQLKSLSNLDRKLEGVLQGVFILLTQQEVHTATYRVKTDLKITGRPVRWMGEWEMTRYAPQTKLK